MYNENVSFCIHQHLKNRWFDASRYRGVWITKNPPSLTVALWNLSGQMCGYQLYQPLNAKLQNNGFDNKYLTWSGAAHQGVVWGLETLKNHSDVFLVEGIFEAARLHSRGLAALAVMCNNPLNLRQWLNLLPQRKIAIAQGDAAGVKLKKFGDIAVTLPLGRDLDELSEPELDAICVNAK